MKTLFLYLKYTLALFLLISSLLSCKKSENAGDDVKEQKAATFGKVAYFAKASSPSMKATSSIKATSTTVQSDTTGNTPPLNTVPVSWSSASMWVEKIVFVGKNDKMIDTTIMVKKKLNIFNSEALMGVIKLPAGSYKDISVKMYCRKNSSSELALDFKGTFTNTKGGKDSLMVRSSIAYIVDIKVNDIVINSADNYKVSFLFDLTKVLTGISNYAIESVNQYWPTDVNKLYVIWKGGSADEPFYNQIVQNWQNVASIVITKEVSNPNWE